MTSTNDGKEVKSNQTSGPKGKTYFIELYKLLDAKLNEQGTASERTSHLCDAWRRVHSLCLHSAPTTHPHLLNWLQRHTARVVLQTTWQTQDRKDERSRLEEAINVFIVESRTAAFSRDGEIPAWETHLVGRGEWFKKILDHPWKHPVLNGLLNQDGTPPTDDEVLEWLKEERGVTFVMRLQTLVAEKKCDDIAILLATAVMERVRKDTVQLSDTDQSEDVKNKPNEASSFGNRLKEEAGFTVDVWEMLTDIEFVLLHKRDSSRCIALAKQTPLRTAYQLIERLQSRLETSPREKRLWKNSKEVAVLIAQVVIARCMVVQQCTGGCRSALYCCARSLARLMAPSRLPSAAAALAGPAPTAAHLHTLAAAIDAQLAQNNEMSMKPFVCELYVRAITAGMNELERLKLKTEKDTEARLMEQTLASWFVQLGCVLASSDRVKCECALTAFSVHPSPQMYERIKAAPLLPPVQLDSVEQSSSEATNPGFGSWASDSRSQTNFVKTSETLNMKARQNQANVLSTTILNEGEALGLSPELCQDITVLLSGPRVKTLSWDMERELLLENCRAYLERTHGGTKAVTTELKYLNLNPDDFQYLPEEDEEENNIYYGIEKGYEHLVEHEPEGIWEDAFEDLEKTETAYSSDEYDFIQPQRKKKTKKIVLKTDEDDPLSTVAEIKRKEKKERPHSKERSREKKKVTDPLEKMEEKAPGDPLEINEGNQDKKKEKPKRERKKKEKAPKPDGALSNLVGLKGGKPKKKAKNPLHLSETHVDNQPKLLMQSLNNEDNVQYDGQFYMDDKKSRRSSHSDGMPNRQDEFSVANKRTATTNNSQQASYNMPNRPPSAIHVSSSSSHMSPSDYSRNNSPTSEEVKNSISKLLEQRRLEAARKKPNAIIRPGGLLPMDKDNITPKGVAIPEIPKSYISKQQSDKLIELKQRVDDILKQRNNAAIPSPVIKYACKNLTSPGKPIQSSSQYNAACQYNKIQKDRMAPSSSDRCFSTPPSSERFMDTVNMVSIYDKNEPSHSRNRFTDKSPFPSVSQDRAKPPDTNYQNYLHEYHKLNTYNHYAEKIEPTKKVMRPVSKVAPVLPNVKSEHKALQSAKQMPQKPDGSLNTFSRLSYYKNKQTDKNKAQDMSQQHQQTVGAKLDGFIMDHLRQSRSHLPSPLNDVQPMVRKHEEHPTHARDQHPIMTNILQGNSHSQYQHKSVIPPKTILSEKDQNDLLLLLRQKNMLNKPHNSPIASCSNTRATHNTQSFPIADCSKAISSSTDAIYESNPVHMNVMASSPSLMTSNPSLMASSPSLMISNPGLMASSSSLITSNSSLVSSNPSVTPSNSTCIPSNHLYPKPHIGKKTKEDKIINILSTSILKSADPKNDSNHKPANTKKSTGQGKSKKAEVKGQKKSVGKSQAAHKDPEEWENVLDALKKQKTPCRGPNALDLALNKSSFEKAFEDSLRNPSSFFTQENYSLKQSIDDYDHEQCVKPTKTVTVSSSVGNIQNTNKKSQSVLKPNLSEPKKHSKTKKCANALTIEKLTQNKIDPSIIEKLMLQNQIEVTRKNCNKVQVEIPEKTQKQSNIVKPTKSSYVESPKMVVQPSLVEMPKMNVRPSLVQINKKTSKQYHAEIPKKDVKEIVVNTYKKEVKQVTDAFKKIPQDIKVKQFTYSGANPDDSFVSGIRNSDYDLLDELMDDDLRKEIGELSSDEEDYNVAQGFLKDTKPCEKPVNVEYNPPPKDLVVKALPVATPPLCKLNDVAQSFTQKPIQQQLNSTEPTLVQMSSQNQPDMCLNVASVQNVTTHVVAKPTQAHTLSNSNDVHSTQITVERNVYLTAVPHSAPNVMIIPPNLVYEGYSSVQTPIQTVTNITPNAYMAVNTPSSISIYQTTQFAAPVINPLIIASAVTVPVVNNVQCVTAVHSTPVTNVTESQYYYPNSDLLQLAHIATAQEKIAVDGNKLEAKESNIVQDYTVENVMQQKHESKIPTDINVNKCGERKVLQEVQEKQADETIDSKRRNQKFDDTDMKTQADYERLTKKRMAILNRKISHFCGVKTIALGYSPLLPSTTTEKKKLEIVDNKSSGEEDLLPIQNNLQELSNDVKSPATPDSYKENKSEPVRRILLRSSNKLKNKTILPTPLKPCIEKKLKASPAVLLNTPNKTCENNQSDVETNNKSKRVSKRIRNKSVTTSNESNNKGTEVASKLPGKKAMPKVARKSKPKHISKNIVKSIPNHDFDNDYFFDIETELIGSTIPKVTSSDLHGPDVPEVSLPETDIKEIEQSPDKEEAVSLPILDDQLQHDKDIPTFKTNNYSTVIPATDPNTTNQSEQIIKLNNETTDESNNVAENKSHETETKVIFKQVMFNENMIDTVEKETMSKVDESIKPNHTDTNNVKKTIPDVSVVPEKISPELMNTLTSPKVQTPVNIIENEKALTQTLTDTEIINIEENSTKDHDNAGNSVGQIKSIKENTEFQKSRTIESEVVTSAAGGDDDDDIQIIEDLSSNTSPTHKPKPQESNSLKDIIIEHVANANSSDPLMKTVRIKLGNNNRFLATISGSVNIDSLLSNPQILSLLKSKLEQSKKVCSLKFSIKTEEKSNGKKILSTHIQQKNKLLEPREPLETVSLLSDDEDEASPQVFETEYGKHLINSMDPESFTKHQTKLKLKSYVKVKKLSTEEENAIKHRSETNIRKTNNVQMQQNCFNLDDVVTIDLKSSTSLQSSETLDQIKISAAIPSKYVKGIFSDIENILAPVQKQPENESVVLIDDSSNDSVKGDQKHEPKEKIDEFKNMLLKDLGVINNITPARSKFKDDTQMSWASEAIDLTDDSVIEPITYIEPITLDKKETYHEIINRKCFVKLVRCDHRVHEPQSEPVKMKGPKAEENYANVPAPRSRSGSFSILEDFPVVHDIKLTKRERNNSSPVMEVYEKIASLEGKFTTSKNTYKLSADALKCDSEWMVTKKVEHWQCLNVLTLENESLQTIVVPRLSTLILTFIQDGDLVNKYVPRFYRSSISLKRKSKTSLLHIAKISKLDYQPNEPQSNDCSLSSTVTLDLSTDASIVTVTEDKLATDSLDITSDMSDIDVTVSEYRENKDINNEHLEEKQVVENIPSKMFKDCVDTQIRVSHDDNDTVLMNTENRVYDTLDITPDLSDFAKLNDLNEISKAITAETLLDVTDDTPTISVTTGSLYLTSPETENYNKTIAAAISQSDVTCESNNAANTSMPIVDVRVSEDNEMSTNQLEAPSLTVNEVLLGVVCSIEQEHWKDGIGNHENESIIDLPGNVQLGDNIDNTAMPIGDRRQSEDNEMDTKQLEVPSLIVSEGLVRDGSITEQGLLKDGLGNHENAESVIDLEGYTEFGDNADNIPMAIDVRVIEDNHVDSHQLEAPSLLANQRLVCDGSSTEQELIKDELNNHDNMININLPDKAVEKPRDNGDGTGMPIRDVRVSEDNEMDNNQLEVPSLIINEGLVSDIPSIEQERIQGKLDNHENEESIIDLPGYTELGVNADNIAIAIDVRVNGDNHVYTYQLEAPSLIDDQGLVSDDSSTEQELIKDENNHENMKNIIDLPNKTIEKPRDNADNTSMPISDVRVSEDNEMDTHQLEAPSIIVNEGLVSDISSIEQERIQGKLDNHENVKNINDLPDKTKEELGDNGDNTGMSIDDVSVSGDHEMDTNQCEASSLIVNEGLVSDIPSIEQECIQGKLDNHENEESIIDLPGYTELGVNADNIAIAIDIRVNEDNHVYTYQLEAPSLIDDQGLVSDDSSTEQELIKNVNNHEHMKNIIDIPDKTIEKPRNNADNTGMPISDVRVSEDNEMDTHQLEAPSIIVNEGLVSDISSIEQERIQGKLDNHENVENINDLPDKTKEELGDNGDNTGMSIDLRVSGDYEMDTNQCEAPSLIVSEGFIGENSSSQQELLKDELDNLVIADELPGSNIQEFSCTNATPYYDEQVVNGKYASIADKDNIFSEVIDVTDIFLVNTAGPQKHIYNPHINEEALEKFSGEAIQPADQHVSTSATICKNFQTTFEMQNTDKPVDTELSDEIISKQPMDESQMDDKCVLLENIHRHPIIVHKPQYLGNAKILEEKICSEKPVDTELSDEIICKQPNDESQVDDKCVLLENIHRHAIIVQKPQDLGIAKILEEKICTEKPVDTELSNEIICKQPDDESQMDDKRVLLENIHRHPVIVQKPQDLGIAKILEEKICIEKPVDTELSDEIVCKQPNDESQMDDKCVLLENIHRHAIIVQKPQDLAIAKNLEEKICIEKPVGTELSDEIICNQPNDASQIDDKCVLLENMHHQPIIVQEPQDLKSAKTLGEKICTDKPVDTELSDEIIRKQPKDESQMDDKYVLLENIHRQSIIVQKPQDLESAIIFGEEICTDKPVGTELSDEIICNQPNDASQIDNKCVLLENMHHQPIIVQEPQDLKSAKTLGVKICTHKIIMTPEKANFKVALNESPENNTNNLEKYSNSNTTRPPQTTDEIIDALNKMFGESEGTVVYNEDNQDKLSSIVNKQNEFSNSEQNETCDLDIDLSEKCHDIGRDRQSNEVCINLKLKYENNTKKSDEESPDKQKIHLKGSRTHFPQTSDEVLAALHKIFGEQDSVDSIGATDVVLTQNNECIQDENSKLNGDNDEIDDNMREGLLIEDYGSDILVEGEVEMLNEEIIEDITFSPALDSTHDVKEASAAEDLEYNQDSVSCEKVYQNIIAKNLKSDTIKNPEIDINGIVYDDTDIGTRYVFSLMKEVPEDNKQDKQSKENIANHCEHEIIEDIKLIVPKFTYSSTVLRVRRSSRNLKRKKDMSDIKTSEKKYRKGKNIDYPKITQSAIAELAYAKEYKRIMDYCSTIKFSYERPFHIEHIEVEKMLEAWPIQKCHAVDVNDSNDVEDILFTDIEDCENTMAITDPLKETLNDEIVNGNNVNDYKSIDINETNFNMGFGERSGRVIQKLETGIKKMSAATLSDVKQYQPLSSSEASTVYKNIAHELETEKDKLARFMNLINIKEKVQSFFKKTTFELNKELLQDKKIESNDSQFTNFPFGLTSSEFMEVPMEIVVNVVQVGQLPVSANAQNPVMCDPRVTHVSDASPSQCSNNSPGEDSQPTMKTEYTELTTANITLPLVQEYAHHHQSPPAEEQNSPGNEDDENMSTLSIVKIELIKEDTEENQENDIYENDFSPLPNNNVEYSFEDTSNTLFNTSANVDNTSTNTHNTSNNMFNTPSNMDNSFTNMFNNSTSMDNTYTNMDNTPSSMDSTYTNMDNASTSVYSTSSNMGNSSTEMDNTNHRNDASPDMDNRTTTNLDNNDSTDNNYTSMYNPMATESNDMSNNTTNVCNTASNIDNSPIDRENRSTNMSTSPNMENSAYDYTYENIEDYAANIENNNNPDNYSTNVDRYPSNVENYSTNVDDYSTNGESYSSNVENYATNAEDYPTGVEHYSTNIDNFPTNAENYAADIGNATSNVDNNMTGIDNSSENLLEDTQPQDLSMGNSAQESKICNTFEGLSPESETARRDQIAHAMNAAGISSESVITSGADEFATLMTQSAQATASNYSKSTPINVMTLQQALAQVLPPQLNQTGTSEKQVPNNPNSVAQQVLHIVQGNNAQTVINKPNGTHLLHIVQNKNNPNVNGLSLVDAGLQQGGNQLIHIVNNGNQNNAQFLKRVNLLTNLTNAQGSNEQKMIQFVCKSADGKSIQLNAGHQRSMVLRLHPTNVQTPPKPTEPQDLSATTNAAANPANNQEPSQGIKSRSVYEENYAQFIQESAPTPGSSTTQCQEKATSLPKFNQVFGKQSYQDNQNEMDHNGLQENSDCPPEENNSHIEQPAEVNNQPLLVRNAPPETTQAQPNPTQSIKQTVSPMNIHTTMHGGVIYTRQIPVNIGGGQTINLITVPSTELVDDSAPKQQTEGTFVNQEGEQSSIIKLVPHHASNNTNVSSEENNVQAGPSNETNHIPQPQPVLTQMRIKLPMLSKGPHIVPGARLVRPSFFQIQRNVIAGTNQPVYQQLVLTTAPSLGQTIRLPSQQPQSDQSPQAQPILVQAAQHTQPSPHIPVQQVQHAPSSQHVHSAQQAHSTPSTTQPQSVQSDHTKPDNKPDSELSTLTLEQLREFDMVLEQVKERSVQPTPSTTPNAPVQPKPTPADSTDGPALATTSVSESTQQVLYSVENNQPSNVVSYVNRKSTITSATKSFVRSPDSSGIVDTPSSSSQVQITHTVTSKSTTIDGSPAVVPHPKKKKKKKSSSSSNALASLGSPSKTNSLKPQEDEQTTQRILYILAEYKEQVENSPDKNKPAPRRRNQFPPTTGSKRKRSHCSSRATCRREGMDMSPTHEHGENGDDSLITLGSEDSSCGTTFSECTDCQESHSPEQDSPTKVVRRLTFEQETTTQITQTRSIPQRNVIVGDGQTITVARTTTATTAKPTTTVLMPANYLLPVSMIKGGQQIAIMTNRGPKILVGAGDTNAGALLFQRLIAPGLKPVLARPGVRHIRLPATALHNLQTFNIQTTPVTQVQPPDSTAQPAPTPAPPDLIDTRAMSSPWQDREAQDKPIRAPSPDCTEPWNMPSSSIADDYGYEEIVRTDNMERTVLDAIPDRYSPDMEAQRIFDKMFDVDSKKSMYDSPRCGYDIDTSDGDDKPYQQVVQQRKDGRHHRVTHVSTAALRHKYAILEHELRLQKSLSEECEDLGVDSPSASDLFPEADILFGAPSPAHEQTIDQCNTPPPIPMHQSIPQPDLDDQIASDHLITNNETRNDEMDLNLDDVGEIVTVGEDGVATIPSINAEEFARSHPNTTFHTEPEEGEITISQPPFTIAQGIKGRHITFHANRVPGTVVMAPQTTVISQAIINSNDTCNTVKFTDIDNMINAMPSPQPVATIPSVLVKDPGITTRPSKFDSLKEPSTSTSRPFSKYDSKFDSLKEPSVSTTRPLSKYDKFDTLKEPSITTSRPSSKFDAKLDSLKEPSISTSRPSSKFDAKLDSLKEPSISTSRPSSKFDAKLDSLKEPNISTSRPSSKFDAKLDSLKEPSISTSRPSSKFDSLKEPSVSTPKPLSKFDSLLTESKLQLSNTSARQIVHSTGHGTQVIRRLRYDERTNTKTNTRFHSEEPRAKTSISDEVKMRNDRAIVESMGDNASSPGQPELFWDSTTTERHERRFHFTESEKVSKSPFDELLNDSSAYGPHTRLDSVIKAARPERTYGRTSFEGISVSGSSEETRPLRTYPPKRVHTHHSQDMERHFTLKTTTTTTHHHELEGATKTTHHQEDRGKKNLPRCQESEGRRRTGRGLVKRGCSCCTGTSAPPKKRSRTKKPSPPDFTAPNS